jgi:hypothetical protein
MEAGAKYGDARLDWILRNKKSDERPLFKSVEDAGTTRFK